MGLWMLILLTVGLLIVGCSAGETPASLGRSVRFMTVATLRSWGLGDAELGLLLAIGLGVWAFTVLGRLRWGRQIGRLEHELLADGLARVGADGLVVIGEAGAPLSSLSSLSALGSTAVLEAPDEALMAGPGAWAAVTSAASTGVVTPWECGVAVERLSRLAADRHRSSSGGWLPLHAGLLFVVLAATRLGAGLGWILGVLVAVLGGLMMIGGSLSFLRDVGYDARLRRALMSWAREACGPWIWPGARGQDGDSSGSALAAWWAVDGSAKPASFFLIMGETAILWWLLLPTGGAPDAAAMILMGLPLLAWLVGVVKLMPLAAGAHRARLAVGLPGKWRVQDHVQEHAGMDGRTTTTIPGWRVLGMPTSTMGGGGWGRGW
jgi:membrane protein